MDFLSPQQWRASWGLILPSPNTATEADFWRIAPRGITFHSARVYVPIEMEGNHDPKTSFHEMLFRPEGREAYKETVKVVKTARPTHVIFPISSESMCWGLDGAKGIQKDFEEWSGVSATVGGLAFLHVLTTLRASRLAILSCHGGEIRDKMHEFLEEAGHKIVRTKEVANESALEILEGTSEEDLVAAAVELDGPDIDVFIQMGANMSTLGLIEKVESRLHKPMLTNNSMVLWSAMRSQGFDDKIEGLGTLWRDN